jgi:hypothetical protein
MTECRLAWCPAPRPKRKIMATYNVGPGQTYASLDNLPRDGNGRMNIPDNSEIVIVGGATINCTQRCFFDNCNSLQIKSSSATAQAIINVNYGSSGFLFNFSGCDTVLIDGLRFNGNTSTKAIWLTSQFTGSGMSNRTVSNWTENVTIQNCDVVYMEAFVHINSAKDVLIQCCNTQKTQEYSIICTDPLDGGNAVKQGTFPNYTFPETYECISRGIQILFCNFGPSERESPVRFGDRWPGLQDLLMEDCTMDATGTFLPDDKHNPLRLHGNWRRTFTTEYTPSAVIRRCRIKGVMKLGPLGHLDATGGADYSQAVNGNNYGVLRQRAFDCRLKNALFVDCYVEGYQVPTSIDDPHGVEEEMGINTTTGIANTLGCQVDQGCIDVEFQDCTIRVKNLASVTNDEFRRVFRRSSFAYPAASQQEPIDATLVLRPVSTMKFSGGVHMRADYFISGSDRAVVIQDSSSYSSGTNTTSTPSGITITGSNTFNGSATFYYRV